MTSPAPRSGGNKTLWIILAVVGVVVVLPCLCCGGITLCTRIVGRTAGTALNKTMTPENMTKLATGGRGSTTELPGNFPSDVPQYRGAKMTLSMDLSDKSSDNGMVTCETSDSVADVVAYYQKSLKDEGWTQVMSMGDTDSRVVSFKKDERNVQVSASKGKATTISITYSGKKGAAE